MNVTRDLSIAYCDGNITEGLKYPAQPRIQGIYSFSVYLSINTQTCQLTIEDDELDICMYCEDVPPSTSWSVL